MVYIENVLYGYALIINVIGFFIMYYDKRKAEKQQFRVSEKTLWKIAWIGGAFGMNIGMKRFRHKTKHRKFVIGLPLIFLFQIIVIFMIFRWCN